LATEGLGNGHLQGRSVLLFDETSRSAAEIVAAFVAEHKLAPIVGTKTAGEVLGAGNFRLPHNYLLRMPVSTWRTWVDETIEGKGVGPNVLVELTLESLTEGVDSQINKAREIASSL
jgi:carboxyl-terminal processing protease